MNPLNHFGIRTRMIRKDTRSYNDSGRVFGGGIVISEPTSTCAHCGKAFSHKGLFCKGNACRDAYEERMVKRGEGKLLEGMR